MEVCVTDIKLVLLPQAHFPLFRKDNTQKRIFLKMYSRTLSRINITFRWCSVHKIPMVYITPREEVAAAAAAAKPLQSCPTLCDPIDGGPLSPRFSRQEHWSGLPFPSPTHKSEKRK